VSQEAIRRIVKRQSYSWVGTTQKGAPPEDPRVAKALETATLDAVGLNQRELDRIYAIQEARENPKMDEGPNAMFSEEKREALRKQVEAYGEVPRSRPRLVAQPHPVPEPQVEYCEEDMGMARYCALEKGHAGEHKDITGN
jgi:hypothetical protein